MDLEPVLWPEAPNPAMHAGMTGLLYIETLVPEKQAAVTSDRTIHKPAMQVYGCSHSKGPGSICCTALHRWGFPAAWPSPRCQWQRLWPRTALCQVIFGHCSVLLWLLSQARLGLEHVCAAWC